MAAKKQESGKTVSTRLPEPYSGWLVSLADRTGIRKSGLMRLFAMLCLDMDMLGISKRLSSIEDELRKLRKDFNDAIE